MSEYLYPYKGAFFEAPFFVNTRAQNNVTQPYINSLFTKARKANENELIPINAPTIRDRT